MTGLKANQGDRRKTDTDKRKRNVGFKKSSLQISSRIKKNRKEIMGYKRPFIGGMQDQGGPMRSKGIVFQEPRPYSKKNQGYTQQYTRQSRQEQEQELRSGRSSKPSESKTKQNLTAGDGKKIYQ
ncbi:hypothetical protein TNCV_2828221 [Trichonephila clavipes]|nr:hypothetical protein TNCV_2828221 [Trichonephila clavipes]